MQFLAPASPYRHNATLAAGSPATWSLIRVAGTGQYHDHELTGQTA